jgi:hypothetical protein
MDKDTSTSQVNSAVSAVKSSNSLQADNQKQAESGYESGSDRAEGR